METKLDARHKSLKSELEQNEEVPTHQAASFIDTCIAAMYLYGDSENDSDDEEEFSQMKDHEVTHRGTSAMKITPVSNEEKHKEEEESKKSDSTGEEDTSSKLKGCLTHILPFVNHQDLLQCRLVNRHFLQTLNNEAAFIEKTKLVVSATSPLMMAIASTSTPFVNVIFTEIDQDLTQQTPGCLNTKYTIPQKFLFKLKSLEIHTSNLYWETVKEILSQTEGLEHLGFVNYQLAELDKDHPSKYQLGEFKEFRVGRTINELKSLAIVMPDKPDMFKYFNMVLSKFIGYSSKSLGHIEITIHNQEQDSSSTEDDATDDEEEGRFCSLLATLILNNQATLDSLNLKLKSATLLHRVVSRVFSEDTVLDLKTFVLSHCETKGINLCSYSIPQREDSDHCRGFIHMSLTSNSDNDNMSGPSNGNGGNLLSSVLTTFLHTQRHLRTIQLPYCGDLGSSESNNGTKDDSILLAISLLHSSRCLTHLCVPNQNYLPHHLLVLFPVLKSLCVGGTPALVPFQSEEVFNNPPLDPQTISYPTLKALAIGSSVICGVGMTETIRKFPNLVDLRITSELPILRDEDLQTLIKCTPLLRSLVVRACDSFTDFGVTGIHINSCEMMTRLNSYRDLDDNLVLSEESSCPTNYHYHRQGRPLSDLRGLRTLQFFGKSNITDVGIHFGMRFPELSHASLPYNEKMTEWGIHKFAENNPSLDSLVICSYSLQDKLRTEAFLLVVNNHPRIRWRRCGFWNQQDDSTLSTNSLNEKEKGSNLASNPIKYAIDAISSALSLKWLRGRRADDVRDTNEYIPIPTASLLFKPLYCCNVCPSHPATAFFSNPTRTNQKQQCQTQMSQTQNDDDLNINSNSYPVELKTCSAGTIDTLSLELD